MLSLFL